MNWFVSYTTKATGRVHLVGPFENYDHAQLFHNGLIYTGVQQYELSAPLDGYVAR